MITTILLSGILVGTQVQMGTVPVKRSGYEVVAYIDGPNSEKNELTISFEQRTSAAFSDTLNLSFGNLAFGELKRVENKLSEEDLRSLGRRVGVLGWDKLSQVVTGVDFESGSVTFWKGPGASAAAQIWVRESSKEAVSVDFLGGDSDLAVCEGQVGEVATPVQITSGVPVSSFSGLRSPVRLTEEPAEYTFANGAVRTHYYLLKDIAIGGLRIPFTVAGDFGGKLPNQSVGIRLQDFGSRRIVVDGIERKLIYQVCDAVTMKEHSLYLLTGISMSWQSDLKLKKPLWRTSDMDWSAVDGFTILEFGRLKAGEIIHEMRQGPSGRFMRRLFGEAKDGNLIKVRDADGKVKVGKLAFPG